MLLDRVDSLQNSGDAGCGGILEYLSIVVEQVVFMPISLSWPLLQRLNLPHQLGADALFLGLVAVCDGIRQQALQLLDFSHVPRSLLHVHATISLLAISASRARAN